MSTHRNFMLICAAALVLTTSIVQASPQKMTQSEAAMPMSTHVPSWLVGTWKLVRCDNIFPGGRRVELYGHAPQGLWMIDKHGNYIMMIARAKRSPFASGDKSKGTPAEYRAASLDSNSHYGTISVQGGKITTHIVQASFPNWVGHSGTRRYTRRGNRLTYIVARPTSGASAGAYGEVVWQRVE